MVKYCPECGAIIEFTTCDTCGFNVKTGPDYPDEFDDYSDDNWAYGTLSPEI